MADCKLPERIFEYLKAPYDFESENLTAPNHSEG